MSVTKWFRGGASGKGLLMWMQCFLCWIACGFSMAIPYLRDDQIKRLMSTTEHDVLNRECNLCMSREVSHGIMWLKKHKGIRGCAGPEQVGGPEQLCVSKEKSTIMHAQSLAKQPGEWRALFCKECTKNQRNDGVVVVKSGGELDVIVRGSVPLDFVPLKGKCHLCYKKAVYGEAWGEGKRCAAHKMPEMVLCNNASQNKCRNPEGCERQATFGSAADGRRAVACALHKRKGDADVRNRLCRSEGCTRRPSYGEIPSKGNNGVPEYCATHRLEGHVDLKNKNRCKVLDQTLTR